MGYAANEIAAAAEEGDFDMLVISTHGVNRLAPSGFWLGR
jgi:nucleotide-binding universal stress UspA family protein